MTLENSLYYDVTYKALVDEGGDSACHPRPPLRLMIITY